MDFSSFSAFCEHLNKSTAAVTTATTTTTTLSNGIYLEVNNNNNNAMTIYCIKYAETEIKT